MDTNTTPVTIGQRIAACRRERGYSQEYVAEKLNVSRQAVSKWEQNLCAPDTYNLIALAELLSVSVEYIATGKTPETPQPASVPVNIGLKVRQIIGIILTSFGLLCALIFLLMESLLAFAGLYIFLIGILCLVIRRHFALVCGWVHLAIFMAIFVGTTIISPLSIFNPEFYHFGNNRATYILSAWWLSFAVLLFLTFRKKLTRLLARIVKKKEK